MLYPGHHHPRISRRTALQAGAVGLLGLGMNHLEALQAAPRPEEAGHPAATAKRVIYIFLSGGLGQHDSFDMKPDAADDVRGALGKGRGDSLRHAVLNQVSQDPPALFEIGENEEYI